MFQNRSLSAWVMGCRVSMVFSYEVIGILRRDLRANVIETPSDLSLQGLLFMLLEPNASGDSSLVSINSYVSRFFNNILSFVRKYPIY